jgi:hypothetical protein
MKKYIKNIVPAVLLALSAGVTTSCVGDLDVEPIDPNLVLLDQETIPNLYKKIVERWK